tara:strand:+ start:81 stop:467 length:387 start_codon:yes stop_codon:yes gene_type:complete
VRFPLPLLLVPAAGALLWIGNPGPRDFADFAGRELSERGIEEFCRDGVLPLMVNLLVENCPRLFRTQREALGDLALQLSQRRNFGFFSLYTTEVGTSGLLAQLPLPRYSLETLAVAGQFIVLRAETID